MLRIVMAAHVHQVGDGRPLAIQQGMPKEPKGHVKERRSSLVRVGLIGYGYWGPNIARNLYGVDACQVAVICDKNPAALERASKAYPGVELTDDISGVLTSAEVDAIAALENGKHVFVEKPFTSTAQQAEHLIELAERNKLKIMVDHTFLFCGAVRKIRQLVDDGTLGALYYFDSTRVNRWWQLGGDI